MKPLLIVVVFASVLGCSAPSPDGTCEVPLFPSHNGDIPPCHWLVDTYGCETFADMTVEDVNGDGLPDAMVDFCLHNGDGGSLTQDVNDPVPSWDSPRNWCYTCD